MGLTITFWFFWHDEQNDKWLNWIFVCRFRSVAYLQQIWWFEVDGEIEFPFSCGTYSLYFRLQLGRTSRRFGRRVNNVDHVHGWDIKPVKFQLSTSDGQKAINQCYLTEPGKWNLYRAGDFVVEDSRVPLKVKFSMTQIDCTHTKGGLCVDSVIICPKWNLIILFRCDLSEVRSNFFDLQVTFLLVKCIMYDIYSEVRSRTILVSNV